MIFAQGDPSAYAYVIESGIVEIAQTVGSEWIVLGRIGQGEIFGEMGLVDERPRSAEALVISDSELTAVTTDEFIQLLFDSPNEGVHYLRALFERLRSMNQRVGQTELRESQVVALEPQVAVPIVRELTVFAASEAVQDRVPPEGIAPQRYPFRIGRVGAMLGENDLEVPDSKPYNVSRHHFVIVREDGGFVVRDRGSYLGTVVNGQHIGGKRDRGEVWLRPGDNEVIAGDHRSPFRFRVHLPH